MFYCTQKKKESRQNNQKNAEYLTNISKTSHHDTENITESAEHLIMISKTSPKSAEHLIIINENITKISRASRDDTKDTIPKTTRKNNKASHHNTEDITNSNIQNLYLYITLLSW